MTMLFAAVHVSVKALCSEGRDHTFDSWVAPENQLFGESVLIWVKEKLSKYEPMMAKTPWDRDSLFDFPDLYQRP